MSEVLDTAWGNVSEFVMETRAEILDRPPSSPAPEQVVLPKTRKKKREARQYKVVIAENPPNLLCCRVHGVLSSVFNLTASEISRVYDDLVSEGVSTVKIYDSAEIAETKAAQANGRYQESACYSSFRGSPFTFERV